MKNDRLAIHFALGTVAPLCRPLKRTYFFLGCDPRAYARGYFLPPLRGWLTHSSKQNFGGRESYGAVDFTPR
jgi:hypothetical protein